MSLFGSLGKALTQIGGAAVGFATGGIGGAITGSGLLRQPSSLPQLPSLFGSGGTFNMPTPTVYGPGGVALPGFGGSSVATSCPKGYHLNKHALAPTKKHGAVPAHSMCVRNRSVNPLNHKALTRSLKRLKRANKLVRKLHGVGSNRGRAVVPSRGHRPGCGCFACKRR